MNATLTEGEARSIAADWHGGKGFPLHVFASTGTVLGDLFDEVDDCVAWATAADMTWDVERLNDLRSFCGQVYETTEPDNQPRSRPVTITHEPESQQITLEQVRTAARSIAAKYPKRTNNGVCLYVVDGKPNCIAAVLVSELELEPLNLELREGLGAWVALDGAWPDRFTAPAVDYVSRLQLHADGELDDGAAEWADVVRKADDDERVDDQ